MKYWVFRFTNCIVFIKICCNCSSLMFNNFTTRNYWVVNNTLLNIFHFHKTYSRIANIIFFIYIWCFLHSHPHLSLFRHWFELHFLSSNIHLHSHDTCFVNVLDSFIPVLRLNSLRVKSSVLFGTRTLLG